MAHPDFESLERLNDEEVQRVLGLTDEVLDGARRVAASLGHDGVIAMARSLLISTVDGHNALAEGD